MQGAPLVNGAVDVPAFDEAALIEALRVDQAGESTPQPVSITDQAKKNPADDLVDQVISQGSINNIAMQHDVSEAEEKPKSRENMRLRELLQTRFSIL